MKLKIRETEWNEWLTKNDDPYSRAVFDYALEWADAIEIAMANGQKVADVFLALEPKGHGITGFQYGCAVSVLAKAWEHGDELRRAHNLKSQIGNEGEKANEDGGVLNPALLSIGQHTHRCLRLRGTVRLPGSSPTV